MESNNASVVPTEPTQKSRERRNRPAKSAQRVERDGERKPVAAEKSSEDHPVPPGPFHAPVYVMPVNPKLAKSKETKLNPGASEFKPSTEVSAPGASEALPTGAGRKANNKPRNPPRSREQRPHQENPYLPVHSVTPVVEGGREQQERIPDERTRAPRSRPRKPKLQIAAERGTYEGPVPVRPMACPVNVLKKNPKLINHTEVKAEPERFEELIELSCPICTDSAAYFAVGKCNHHVCSLCAVRMRVKSKDTHCAICKEDLGVMVIYNAHPPHAKASAGPVDESQLLRPFNSFGLTAADCDVDNGNIPGVQVDPSAGFLFVDCSKHYNEIENLRAMVCPFKHCKARFPTIQTLQKHLKEQHKDSALCTLCVENRPLFISEHTVMNPKQLMCHFKGEEFVEAHGHHRAQTSENVHTKGHPQCEFCTERFFDNAALYYHMQRQYFTCHLCPRQHMFRYYIDAAALREHHNRDHIVCSICAASPQLYDSDVAIAFRDAREYSDHMRHVHNAHVSSAAGGSNHNKTSFRLGASSTYQSNNPSAVRRDKHGRPRVTVVDLDMGSANPNARADVETTGSNAARAAAAAAGRPAETPAAALIPANMRIAGRVTGAGRFAELDSQDLLMQAAAEEYAAAAERQARGQKKSLRVSHEQAFPTLSASAGVPAVLKNRVWSAKVGGSQGEFSSSEAATGSSSANDSPLPSRSAPAAELHPMSLLHSSKQQAKDLQRRKDAEAAEKAHQEKLRLEDKRIERNLSLASALLGGSGAKGTAGLNLTAADVGATLKNRSYVNSIVTPLNDLGWTEAELMRPIYPPVLVNWARLHQSELLKIEKKIHALMTDASLNSVQLKPMARGMRIVVHQLSRMYLLNSYEYDPEPSRYVSLVKQVDSYLPSCVLSRAAALPVHTLPGENGTEVPDLPVVYLTLSSESYSAGLVNTNSSVSSAGKKAPAPGVTGTSDSVRIAFTTAEIVSRIKDLLESPELWRAWYQYALEAGAPAGPPPPVPEMVLNEYGEYEELPVPPPPPGFVSSPSVKPRALSELPVPRIVSLVAAGASTVGLRFLDRTSAQFAVHFMNFCVSLHYSSVGSNTKMSSRAQYGSIALDAAQLSPKQQQQLTVLSVFTLNAAFSVCSVTDLVYATPQSDKGVAAAPRLPGSDVQAATLDRRHYMPAASSPEESWTTASKAKSVSAVAATATSSKPPVGADGWQYQAVKTRRYDADDPAVNKAVPLQSVPVDSWEDLDQLPGDFNQKVPAEEDPAQAAERAEEWESFLTEKRSKAEQTGVARYQPKRPEPAAADATSAPSKYVPPSARARAAESATVGAEFNSKPSAVVEEEGDEEVFAEEAYALDGEVAEPLEEEYDLCDRNLTEGDAGTASVPAAVFDTDYMDSEEAFEEYLRQLQLQHELGEAQGARAQPQGQGQSQRQRQGERGGRQQREIVAQPFNAALSHITPSVFDNAPSSAMAVVAIPISDDVSDEEVAREVLRKQMKTEQGALQYNKFGVLDEEDADNEA